MVSSERLVCGDYNRQALFEEPTNFNCDSDTPRFLTLTDGDRMVLRADSKSLVSCFV